MDKWMKIDGVNWNVSFMSSFATVTEWVEYNSTGFHSEATLKKAYEFAVKPTAEKPKKEGAK